MRLANIRAKDGFVLEMEWTDGQRNRADLSGLVMASKHFRSFADNPDDFKRIEIINWGDGVAWENGLDYSAENLMRIATMQAQHDDRTEIRDFQARFNLTNDQAGRALGYKVSQIKNFRAGHNPLPTSVRVAIRTMEEDPTILYAALASKSAKKEAVH